MHNSFIEEILESYSFIHDFTNIAELNPVLVYEVPLSHHGIYTKWTPNIQIAVSSIPIEKETNGQVAEKDLEGHGVEIVVTDMQKYTEENTSLLSKEYNLRITNIERTMLDVLAYDLSPTISGEAFADYYTSNEFLNNIWGNFPELAEKEGLSEIFKDLKEFAEDYYSH